MKPIPRITIVLISSIVIGQLIYIPFSKALAKYNWTTDKRLQEILNNKTSYDVLFIGSSRTQRHIYPKIVDSICGVNSYNAGCAFGRLAEMRMMLDAYLVNHPAPKLLVLNLDLFSFEKYNFIFKYTQYFPFLNNKVIYNTLSDYGYKVWIIRLIPYIGISDIDDPGKINAIKVMLGSRGTELNEGEFEYKGFLSCSNMYQTRYLPPKIERINISKIAVTYLNNIIDTCRRHNIKLVFTYAPEYDFNLQKGTSNTKEIFDFISQIAQTNNIPFFRYDSLPMCKDYTLFQNAGHLNKPGSMIYTSIQAEDLKNIYRQKIDSLARGHS